MKRFFKIFSVLLILVLSSTSTFAQQTQLKGRVINKSTEEPILGATVVVEGTTRGTTTDIDGSFILSVEKGETLSVSSLDYTKQSVLVGDATFLTIALEEGSILVDNVVVTALGMTRKERALGYAVSTVEGDELTQSVSSNWLNGMSGKVAGLNFDQASTGPGGSIRVTLRGEGSLTPGKNEALIVVDGVPINSTMTSSSGASSYDNADAPVDYGNGASDINPDDIESVSVLKGPSATALYGSRAGAGAIIITTKGGRKSTGLGVNYSFSMTMEDASYWPDFQEEYGPGNSSQQTYSFYTITDPSLTVEGETASRNHSRYAFGPKYDGQMFYQYASKDWETGTYEKLPWVPRDWYEGFFQTGVTYRHSISVDGNNGKGTSYRMGFTNTKNEWIIPNTGYRNQAFSLTANQKINDYITASAKVNYHRKMSDNLPMTGYSAASPMYSLMWSPINADIDWYYDEWASGRITREAVQNGENLNYLTDNPYLQVYEQLNTMARDRIYGSASITAQLHKNLTLLLRSGIDFTSEFRTQQKPKESVKFIDGYYKEQTTKRFEMNNEFMFNYTNTFGDFDLGVVFGGNNMVSRYNGMQIIAERLDLPDVYMLSNSAVPYIVKPTEVQKSINSFYGMASLSWRDMVYLDITGRNDWSSALSPDYNSYFYPSISTSVILSEAFDFEQNLEWFNFLKARISWADVGNDTDAYNLVDYYGNSEFASSFYMYGAMNNYHLRHESVSSFEVGLEGRMLDYRIGFDIAYYNSTTSDQITYIPIDQITGSTSQLINAGEVNNQGVEVALNFEPVKTRDFSWSMNLIWSKNWNKLIELAPSVDVWQMNTSNTIGSRVFIYAYPGQDMGSIYGRGYERAPEGATYVDENGDVHSAAGQVIVDADGLPVISSDLQRLGSVFPQWKAGMSHSFKYKDFSLSMTFTGQYGGKAYSLTNAILGYQGKLESTLPGRYDGLVHPGVNYDDETGTYTKNTTVTSDIVDYYNKRVLNRDNAEENTFDTSFIKFKEARLDYSLPKKLLSNVKWIQGASIGVYATNIFCITDFPQFDPEAATMNGSSISRGIEVGAYPMTRTYGFNLKIEF